MRLRTCVQLKMYLTRFSGAETASASAASSAGKTLRAFSPASLASPVTTVVDSYCGRPG